MYKRTFGKTLLIVALAAVLATGHAFAAEESTAELEKKLEAAKERLNEAAREVGELSVKLGQPWVQRFEWAFTGPRAIIGVQLDPNSPKTGARVDRVSPGGPAAEAGVRPGDLIVAINGKSVEGDRPASEVVRIMRDVEPDSTVKLRLRRGDSTVDVDVVARAAPRPEPFAFEMPQLPRFDGMDWIQGWRGVWSGMELATLTPQLGKYFGTKEGVLVLRAPEGDALKLQDGDVILSIDGRKPTSGSHATRILRSYQPGEQIRLRILRERKEMDLNVTLPEPPKHRPERREERQHRQMRFEEHA
ncbi:MAG TPA: PDZ domain-containing protein [Steroidobacteraceae bacterium]